MKYLIFILFPILLYPQASNTGTEQGASNNDVLLYNSATGVYENRTQSEFQDTMGIGGRTTPEHYGAIVNDGIDDVDAILKASQTGKIVVFQSGATYDVDNASQITISVATYGNISWMSSIPGENAIIHPLHSDVNLFKITGGDASGFSSIDSLKQDGVMDRMWFLVYDNSGMAVGDIVDFRQVTSGRIDQTYGDSSDYHGAQKKQVFIIDRLSSDTVFVTTTLKDYWDISSDVDSTIQVWYRQPISVHIKDITFEFDSNNLGTNALAIEANYWNDFKLENVKCLHTNTAGIIFTYCMNGVIEDPYYAYCNYSGYGYGQLLQGCENIMTRNIRAFSCRSGFDMGNGTRHCTIDGGFINGGGQSETLPSDRRGGGTHQGTEDILIKNLYIEGVAGGIACRGADEWIDNVHFSALTGYCITKNGGEGLIVINSFYDNGHQNRNLDLAYRDLDSNNATAFIYLTDNAGHHNYGRYIIKNNTANGLLQTFLDIHTSIDTLWHLDFENNYAVFDVTTASAVTMINGSNTIIRDSKFNNNYGVVMSDESSVFFKYNPGLSFINSEVGGVYCTTLIDDGSFNLETGTPSSGINGFATLVAGDTLYAHFWFSSTGAVTLIDTSAYVATTDIDNNLCIFNSGSNYVTIRNRTGAALAIAIKTDYNY